MSLRTLFLGLLAVAVLSGSPALAAELPGFNYSLAAPTGESWSPPEGIELAAVIESYNPFDPETCKRPDAEAAEAALEQVGLPVGQVRVCLQFRNTTGGPINVELPPGLIFVSESQKVQSGMIVQKLTIEVPSDQYMVSPLRADCINTPRGIPGIGDRYRIGPVIQHRHIVEALRLLADRDLSDPIDAATASSVLKPLYLGKALTQDGRDTIADLPARVPA